MWSLSLAVCGQGLLNARRIVVRLQFGLQGSVLVFNHFLRIVGEYSL